MTHWKEAITHRIEHDVDCGKTFVWNAEERLGFTDILLQAYHPQAGAITYTYATERYRVANDHTFAFRNDLSLEEVEQALNDLGIADSDWR